MQNNFDQILNEFEEKHCRFEATDGGPYYHVETEGHELKSWLKEKLTQVEAQIRQEEQARHLAELQELVMKMKIGNLSDLPDEVSKL